MLGWHINENTPALGPFLINLRSTMRLTISIFLISILFSTAVFADNDNETIAPPTIKGFVYDSLELAPMEYATVALMQASDSSLVTGVITDINGFFRLRDVEYGRYFLEVSFIGYHDKTAEVFELSEQQRTVDLERILVMPARENLEEVSVVADRPTMTYRIDKKVINVSQQHTSASGTAVEVLENIPSVTVSIEGDVSLRGSSSFTVLIDGKPSIMDANDILNQIPASQIENIEIITNPSARYDPDGVAGIINIVMKRHRLQGLNGIINASAGTQSRLGGDFLLNYRIERFNFFLGADYNQRAMTGSSITRRETYLADTTFLYSDGDFDRNRTSWGVRAGLDFNMDPDNTLSLAYRLNYREGGQESDRLYEEWSSLNPDPEVYYSFEEGERSGTSHSFTLDYIRDFDHEGHNLIAQAIASVRDSDDFSLNLLQDEFRQTTSGQRSLEQGPSSRMTFKLDYTLPFGEERRLETGYQLRINDSDESNELFQYQPLTGDFVADDLFSKEVNYSNTIHSVYSTFSGERNDFGYQLGVRGEYTDRLINLIGEPDEFPLERWDLYPTLHFSYRLPADQQMMASYTRRLQRLRGWYLEPFYTWDDAYNIRIGNPGLDPEYIDSYELSYQNRFQKNTLSVDLYYRVTHNKIERVRSIFDEQQNVVLSTFANVGQDYSLGMEIMTGFDPTSWWHFDLMGNLYDYRQEGNFNGRDYTASSFNWNLRINNDFRITPTTQLQLRGMYNSPTVTAQGERTGFFVTNLALRQNFLDRALSLTLQVRDIFSTMGRESIVRGQDLYQFSKWMPDTPIISVTASFRINNYRSERRGPERGSEMDQDGEEF